MFSMITARPSSSPSCAASGRAKVSVPPPGANGLMTRTGFCGQSCASAALPVSAAMKNDARRTIRMTTLLRRFKQYYLGDIVRRMTGPRLAGLLLGLPGLVPCFEHHPEARLAAHHSLVG